MSSNSNSSVPLSNTSFSSYLRETAENRFHTHHAVWGIDHALRLGDPLLPGEDVPQFEETGLRSNNKKEITNTRDFLGRPYLIVFHSGAFTASGENASSLITDLSLTKEVKLDYLIISTDSMEVHEAWSNMRDLGSLPVTATMISDKTGDIAKAFGVLDIETHTAYNSVFLIDKQGIVQAARICAFPDVPAIGSNTGVGDVLDLLGAAL